MCFTLFKNLKISIINFTVTIEKMMSVKTFLRNFLVYICAYIHRKFLVYTRLIWLWVTQFICYILVSKINRTRYFFQNEKLYYLATTVRNEMCIRGKSLEKTKFAGWKRQRKRQTKSKKESTSFWIIKLAHEYCWSNSH